MNIVVFGAGGRVGRKAVAEARRRGHQVTAVVREPACHGDLSDVRIVAGDVTDATSIGRAAAGHDAAISAAVDLSVPVHEFFTASSPALTTGLANAGVRRLLVVGLASIMPGASGVPLMDEPGYPNEYRSFYLGRAAGLAGCGPAASTGHAWPLRATSTTAARAPAGTGSPNTATRPTGSPTRTSRLRCWTRSRRLATTR